MSQAVVSGGDFWEVLEAAEHAVTLCCLPRFLPADILERSLGVPRTEAERRYWRQPYEPDPGRAGGGNEMFHLSEMMSSPGCPSP